MADKEQVDQYQLTSTSVKGLKLTLVFSDLVKSGLATIGGAGEEADDDEMGVGAGAGAEAVFCCNERPDASEQRQFRRQTPWSKPERWRLVATVSRLTSDPSCTLSVR